jgi:hypothetical protein
MRPCASCSRAWAEKVSPAGASARIRASAAGNGRLAPRAVSRRRVHGGYERLLADVASGSQAVSGCSTPRGDHAVNVHALLATGVTTGRSCPAHHHQPGRRWVAPEAPGHPRPLRPCSRNAVARLAQLAVKCQSGWLAVQQRCPERRSFEAPLPVPWAVLLGAATVWSSITRSGLAWAVLRAEIIAE